MGDLEVYEMEPGNAFLLSSLFHEVEVALAELDAPLDVVAGGPERLTIS